MTDNSSAYRSRHFADAVATAGLRHIRTRPYTPRTNGKAERLREWTYARLFHSSAERAPPMLPWSNQYNHSRPHSPSAVNHPISRIARDNLLGHDS
jgi:transposase InsO family protein